MVEAAMRKLVVSLQMSQLRQWVILFSMKRHYLPDKNRRR